MKKITRKLSIVLVLGAVLVTACNKKLSIDPRQSISFESALTNAGNVNAAVNAVYGGMRNQLLYGRDYLALTDALADITTATGKSGRLQPENRNTQGSHIASWGTAYALLNEINLILEALPNIADATTAQKDQWEGEMKFVRALLHHDLARSYAYDTTAVIGANYRGNIVLALKAFRDGTTALDYRPARNSTKEVYESIYADLTVATTKLGNTRGVYYATKASAHALFSRVALYYGDYSRAVTEATTAIAQAAGLGAALSSSANYLAGWRALRNPESIYEVRFNIQNENLGVNVSLQTSYTTLNTLGNTSSTGGFGDLVPNNFFLGQVGVGTTGFPNISRGADVRANLYEWGTAGRGTRFIECTKFFGKSGFPNLDNVPVIRFPELLLNRAEAYYKRGGAGDEALALADLNSVITNRGLTAVTLTGAALFNEIMRQRMLEFAFEGHRWFDLKRNGLDVVKSPATIPFTDTRILPGIPQRDIDGNPNMRQNPGY